jgi:hypothetical protein
VHDALLTDIARMVYDNLLGPNGPGLAGAEHGRLASGESLELA